GAARRRRIAASCWERMKTEVRLPPASCAYLCTSLGRGQDSPPSSCGRVHRGAPRSSRRPHSDRGQRSESAAGASSSASGAITLARRESSGSVSVQARCPALPSLIDHTLPAVTEFAFLRHQPSVKSMQLSPRLGREISLAEEVEAHIVECGAR